MKSASLWQKLWDYDPNGLVAVNLDLKIVVVNPAFCTFFQTEDDDLIGRDVREIMCIGDQFLHAWETKSVIKGVENHYPALNLFVRNVIFPLPQEKLIACILVDYSQEEQQRQEMNELKKLSLAKVEQVINKQMKTAQEIAGLLGETTAETKASLLQVQALLNEDAS
jgi:hypothetical protein